MPFSACKKCCFQEVFRRKLKFKEEYRAVMVGRVILLLILILVNGFFSCAEIAVLQVGETKIRKLSEEGNKKAKKLLKFTEEPSRFLSTIQVAITLAGFLSSAFAAEGFAGLLDSLALRLLPGIRVEVIHPVSIVLLTFIILYQYCFRRTCSEETCPGVYRSHCFEYCVNSQLCFRTGNPSRFSSFRVHQCDSSFYRHRSG